MKLILLLAGSYSSCQKTQRVWQEVSLKHNLEISILDLEHKDGQTLAERLNLKSFPALINNNKVIAVGNPDYQKAEKIISDILEN